MLLINDIGYDPYLLNFFETYLIGILSSNEMV